MNNNPVRYQRIVILMVVVNQLRVLRNPFLPILTGDECRIRTQTPLPDQYRQKEMFDFEACACRASFFSLMMQKAESPRRIISHLERKIVDRIML